MFTHKCSKALRLQGNVKESRSAGISDSLFNPTIRVCSLEVHRTLLKLISFIHCGLPGLYSIYTKNLKQQVNKTISNTFFQLLSLSKHLPTPEHLYKHRKPQRTEQRFQRHVFLCCSLEIVIGDVRNERINFTALCFIVKNSTCDNFKSPF